MIAKHVETFVEILVEKEKELEEEINESTSWKFSIELNECNAETLRLEAIFQTKWFTNIWRRLRRR